MKTSQHNLQRAKLDPRSNAWDRIVSIYQPLIHGWMRRFGVADDDAADLTQEVLLALVNKLPEFEHNGRTGAFRCWLKAITVNHCRRYWEQRKKNARFVGNQEAENLIELLADEKSDLSRRWDEQHDRDVLNGILESIKSDFDEKTMIAFRRSAIVGDPAREIAKDLGINVGQVYKYKFRVMKRLQGIAKGIIESEKNLSETLG
ncbi:MAG: RNA polymerase sigma factor [Mariniblastus sp.]